jgi:hypothetical protein
MLMRIALLFSITWIARLTEPLINVGGFSLSGRDLILLVGGLFLIAKATYELHERLEGEVGHSSAKVAASFASVITQVMLLDIVFSLDSVITAIGMSNHLGVMVAAVMASVLLMLVASEPISAFRRRASDHQGARAVVPHAHRHVARRRRARPAHFEGLHLLRDGLLGVRRNDQHPGAQEDEAGRPAPAVCRGEVTCTDAVAF